MKTHRSPARRPHVAPRQLWTLRVWLLGASLLFSAGMVGCSDTAPPRSEPSASDRKPEEADSPSPVAAVDPMVAAAVKTLEEAGVKLVAKGEDVTEVDFDAVAATDALAEAVSKMPKLTKLTIRESTMSVDGWGKLGAAATLEQIDVRDCPLGNDHFLALTKDLPRLKAVRLSGKSGLTQVEDAGLVNLGKCPKLKLVALDGLWVSGDGLQHFAACSDMSELYLAGTLVDDSAMEVVVGFPKLSKLRLAKTSVGASGLQTIAALPITELDLSECTQVLDEAMPVVAKFQSLKRLNLWRDSISDSGVSHLAGLKEMEWLNLDNTHIGDGALAHLSGMSKLDFLHLGSTAVTNASMKELAALKSLRELKVTRTAVTEEGVAELKQINPQLDVQIKYVEGAAP